MFTWLTNALSNKYEVCYCNLSGVQPFYELNSNVRYIELNSKRSNSFLERNTVGFVKNVIDLTNLVKKNNYDVIVNFSDHAFYALLFVKLFTKRKLLVSQRVDPFSCKKITEKFRMFLFRYCDGLVCQTDSAESYFHGKQYNSLKKVVIANPSLGKTHLQWDAERNDGYIVSLARVDIEQKRQDILINAMKLVHKVYPDINLRIYGKDVNNSILQLKKMVEENHLERNVEFCGVTNEVYEILSRSRMMVLSSDYEGIPNAIIEAMEVGVPIISTDCKPGGARMLLQNGSGGIIVKCGDYEQLADAILLYLQKPQIAIEKAKAAHDSLYRFDEEKIAGEWEEMIMAI